MIKNNQIFKLLNRQFSWPTVYCSQHNDSIRAGRLKGVCG